MPSMPRTPRRRATLLEALEHIVDDPVLFDDGDGDDVDTDEPTCDAA